jgi:MbtH protein
MSQQFDDENGSYVVLTNDDGQHSLWPNTIEIPDGWTTTYGPSSRPECIAFTESNWTDMRPRRLVSSMERPTSGGGDLAGR